jgi:hypothetical protein
MRRWSQAAAAAKRGGYAGTNAPAHAYVWDLRPDLQGTVQRVVTDGIEAPTVSLRAQTTLTRSSLPSSCPIEVSAR